MTAFAAWGLCLLGIAVITTVSEMLLPSGRLQKVIRSVTATVALLAVVTPMPQLFKSWGISVDGGQSAVTTDGEYIEYVNGLTADIIAKNASEYIRSLGYGEQFTLSVTLDGYRVKSARVDFSENGITGDNAHIHKKEIVKSVAEYFSIDVEAVMSYG